MLVVVSTKRPCSIEGGVWRLFVRVVGMGGGLWAYGV